MINITERAKKHFINLLSKQKKGTQIRIFIVNPNSFKEEYCITYCSFETIKKDDIKLKFNYFDVYVDKTSIPHLKNAKIDLIKNKLGTQIILNTTNFKKNKNNTTLYRRVNKFLEFEINPKLILHGGKIKLIEITNDMNAIIKFEGNCKGCHMVDYTFKKWIIIELLNNFSELKKINDVTEHY